MSLPQIMARLLTLTFVFALLFGSLGVQAEARTKKKSKTRTSAKSRTTAKRKVQSKKTLARKSRRYRRSTPRRAETPPPGNPVIVPDKIEVIETGPADAETLSRFFNLRKSSDSAMAFTNVTSSSNSIKRIKVSMDSDRISEIQQALANRGFLETEPTGVYDDSTVDAMSRFQKSQKIRVTGYPTAHALNRLGLAK